MTQFAFSPAKAPYPVLPEKLQRSDVERILTAVSRAIGMSAARLRALLVMIQSTRPRDWTTTAQDPVCYMRQTRLAARLGITPRALRNHEVALERLGLIQKTTAANGSRGCFADGAVVQGISFSPLIRLLPQLLGIQARIHDDEQRLQVLRRQVSTARRALADAIVKLGYQGAVHSEVEELLRLQALLPRRYEGLTAEALEAVRRDIERSICRVDGMGAREPETSGQAETYIRPYTQETKEDYKEGAIGKPGSCDSSNEQERSEAAPDESHSAARLAKAKPKRRWPYLLWQHVHDAKDLTPRKLYEIASPDMKMYIDAQRQGQEALTADDFIAAVIGYLPNIEIRPPLWNAAVEALGPFAAALLVVAVDAERLDPDRPIRNPGGVIQELLRGIRADDPCIHHGPTGDDLAVMGGDEKCATDAFAVLCHVDKVTDGVDAPRRHRCANVAGVESRYGGERPWERLASPLPHWPELPAGYGKGASSGESAEPCCRSL